MQEENFTIAPLMTMEQYHECERLQQAIWQPDPRDIPKAKAAMLIAAQRYGGVVLGAFDHDGRMIGFVFGFPGRVPPDNPAAAGVEWQHCSRLAGVLPEWQGRGVGYQLKLAQREWVLRQGLELITWTFDPLEAGNGTLNLGKLGVVCRCYLRDFYGEMGEGINAGLPTDRFEVAWWLDSEHVRTRVERGWQPPTLQELLDQGATILNPGQPRPDGWLAPAPLRPPEGPRVLIEIPPRIQALKAASMELALEWRLSVRQASEAAFAAGYTACDVVRGEVEGIPRVWYVLERET